MKPLEQLRGTAVKDFSQSNALAQPQPAVNEDLEITSSLEDFQTVEQRRVLDTVAQVRKCGLESTLSLPQLVICGDQSAGKSSVLEALTDIPFPRNDNLCTRFATEIMLRRANVNSLTIKLIPDPERPSNEQTNIEAFEQSMTDFHELPKIMNHAMAVMDIGGKPSGGSLTRAFAKDVLFIEIKGPSRPQLTLVDIPGLIQTDTKGVARADVDLVEEITDQYIKQPHAICLAVVSAANDYSNQKILTKVREHDPEGDRTLGIITKPDRLDSGSGSESAFIELAQNQDILFKLGWHVLKNRKVDERHFSPMERNMAENAYFRTSNFNCLPADCVGIDALRIRLSKLLFEHVRQELPKLQSDLDEALKTTNSQLNVMGDRRTTTVECKIYLTRLILACWETCKAAVDGRYEGEFFENDTDKDLTFSLDSPTSIRRLRAVIQLMNAHFADMICVNGYTLQIDRSEVTDGARFVPTYRRLKLIEAQGKAQCSSLKPPIETDGVEALANETRKARRKDRKWARRTLIRTHGKELTGNFNPLLISQLLWEQCSKWNEIALKFLDQVHEVCSKFLKQLLKDKCPKDITNRLHTYLVQDALKARYENALEELKRIMEDVRSHPIKYNHYYTDTIDKLRQQGHKSSLASCIEDATTNQHLHGCNLTHTSASVDVDQAVAAFSQELDPNMENASWKENLDCLRSIYKATQKNFIANITTQVIERHMVRDLEKIFSPVVINRLTDAEVEALASEPDSAKRKRQFLEDRIAKLEDAQKVFRSVMSSAFS